MKEGSEPTVPRPASERAAGLIGLFCPDPAGFGVVTAVSAASVPAPDRQLLDHRGHMTVTMERLHGCAVELRVIAERHDADAGHDRYAREILLVRPDGVVVQYGIVRIDLSSMDSATAAAIRERSAPLGRILLGAGLLCDVQRVELLRVEPANHLRDLVGDVSPLHGRVAEIAIAGRTVIELLEIAVPPPAPDARSGTRR
jgi:chorismate-pyruvate lyase